MWMIIWLIVFYGHVVLFFQLFSLRPPVYAFHCVHFSTRFNCKPTLSVIGTLGFDQTLSFYSITLPQFWSMLCFSWSQIWELIWIGPVILLAKTCQLSHGGHRWVIKNHKTKMTMWIFSPLFFWWDQMNVKNTMLIITRQEEELLGCFCSRMAC